MTYRSMRFKKYYDILRTNEPFLKTSLKQKWKILWNILKFYKNNFNKSLILTNKPVVAQIEPTSLCNLRCEMCIREKIGVPIGTMKLDDFKTILNKLDSLFKIHLSGQGEAFLNRELFDMIEYANKRGIIVNLNTNATIFTPEMMKKITEVNLGEIAISFESTNKKEYEQIRKGAKFEEVVKNVQRLNLCLERSKKKTIVSLAVTILEKNIKELSNFVLFAKKLGVKKIIAQTVQEKEDYVQNYDSGIKTSLTSRYQEELKKQIKLTKNFSKKEGINFIFDEEKSKGCVWPWRSIYITWDGNVTPCCKILNYKKDGMGNLLKEDFWSIWNGERYQRVRKLLKKRVAPKPCVGCKMV